MKHAPFFFSIIISLAITTAACGGNNSAELIESTLRDAEKAVADGDLPTAHSLAVDLTGGESLQKLSATQTARLSMVFMQIAEALDTDNNANSDRATDLYDRAFNLNADSAAMFYMTVEPEHMQYVETLSARSVHRKNPVDISRLPDEEGSDTIDTHTDNL